MALKDVPYGINFMFMKSWRLIVLLITAFMVFYRMLILRFWMN